MSQTLAIHTLIIKTEINAVSKGFHWTVNPLAPELDPPPSTLMAIQPFKELTARHIYIYIYVVRRQRVN